MEFDWHVGEFINEHEDDITKRTRNKVFESYLSFCKEKNYLKASVIAFSRNMKKYGYEVKRVRVDGKLTSFYVKI